MDLAAVRRAEALPVCQPDPHLDPGPPSRRSAAYLDTFVEEVLSSNVTEGIVVRSGVTRILREFPLRDQTFVDNDASAGIILTLVDTLMWARQLHLEVVEVESDESGSINPGVMAHMMSLQGTLHACLRQAIDIHQRLHNE